MYREASERPAGTGAFFSSELNIPYTPSVAANLPASSSGLDIIVSTPAIWKRFFPLSSTFGARFIRPG